MSSVNMGSLPLGGSAPVAFRHPDIPVSVGLYEQYYRSLKGGLPANPPGDANEAQAFKNVYGEAAYTNYMNRTAATPATAATGAPSTGLSRVWGGLTSGPSVVAPAGGTSGLNYTMPNPVPSTGPTSTPSTSGGWTDTLKKVGAGITQYLPLALSAYQVYQSAKDSKASQGLANEAVDVARDRWAAGAPLRDLGGSMAVDTLQTPITPYAAMGGYSDAGNPYTHALGGAPAGQAAPPASAPAGSSTALQAAMDPQLGQPRRLGGGVIPLGTGRTLSARRTP